MTFVKPYLKGNPMEIENMEPSVMAGNIVLSTMLGPPFKWRTNRASVNFPISGSGTDYQQLVPTFGFIEEAWVIDGNGNQSPLVLATCLPQNSSALAAKPTKIAAQYDDNNGNITFRVDNTPDQAYTLYLDFQNSAPLLTSPASTWAPVSDYFNYIYSFGYMALMCLITNDARFPIFEKYFIGRLLGAQSGISEQDRDIFLATWANKAMTMKRADAASTPTLA